MKLRVVLCAMLLLVLFTSSVTFADDGVMFRRNVSKTPDQESERANINHMAFYVPAQTSDGTLTSIEYYDAAEALVETRDYAKPLVAVFIDALPEEHIEDAANIMSGGAGIGAHDAYAALSLDDGATWKRTNLSLSADLSSFTLADGTPFPGDAHNMTFAIAGDKVLVGWISRYCDGGAPAYTLTDENDADGDGNTTEKLYPDIWGVMGTQGSVDYTLQGFPEVGEIPYSCVWAARGALLPVELADGSSGYDIIWTKAERLTSGRRDANRLEMNGDSAAGFMMVWQEDPEGLRPGQGLGPGEGWSGAVVNGKTDLWYSYISMADFVQVQTSDEDLTPISIYDYIGETMPKVAAPMALPVRLTDNDMCKASGSEPYCYIDFENVDTEGNLILPDELPTASTAESDFCATQVSWTTPGGSTLNLCVAEDGRVMAGRVGASRPRVNVQPYDSDGDLVYDSAWVIMGAEESKALGEGSVDDIDGDEEIEPEDIGKNMWYYTFDMLKPDVVQQGLMLNQPAIDPETGTFFETLTDDWGNEFYGTEISRRFSHFSQPIHQIGSSGVGAVLIVKQGILNQGGPADIFLRLLKVPDEVWIACETDGNAATTERCLPAGYNPYAYENLVCDEWAYTDGSNPRYLEGLCLSNMINVSGTTIDACDNGTSGETCADAFPWDGGVSPFPKVTQWSQTVDNLSDQSWANPYDVSKGHRGFIDGDFIMMMYAWSPNWQANSVGNDHYNLYARRSFDGGQTWTTTPASLGGDGTETCENFKGADGTITTVCTTYGPGEFEQARNLSQLIGNKETILDPRYTPTGGLKMLPITDLKGTGFTGYDDDVRDPSKFFIVYETGDNTTVAEGEAVPLDLFYSRATGWGDDYDLVEYYNSSTGETEMSFDWLEHDREDLSGEAANTCNNAGTFYYVIWNQWQEDEYENVSESDAIFRRIMYLEDAEANPTAQILFVSATEVTYEEGGEIEFVGSGRDNDRMGDEQVTAFKWISDIDGILSWDKSFKVDVYKLSIGTHTITLVVRDGEGNWSHPVSVTIKVAETLADLQQKTIYLPLVSR
ncbi:MAG: choice-of-anchor O protein [Chloroflexota bacterium]